MQKTYRTKKQTADTSKGQRPANNFLPFFNASTYKTHNTLFLNSTIIPASFFNNNASIIAMKDIDSRLTTHHLNIAKQNSAKGIFY